MSGAAVAAAREQHFTPGTRHSYQTVYAMNRVHPAHVLHRLSAGALMPGHTTPIIRRTISHVGYTDGADT